MRALFFACLIALAATSARAAPSYQKVAGVAEGDTLNVRAGPSPEAEILGELPRDAAAIEVLDTDPGGDWARIAWEEGHGWLATAFLQEDPVPVIGGTALPVGLLCSGTEPFWSMRLSDGSAVFSDMSGRNLALGFSGARVAAGHRDFPVALSHSAPGSGALTVVSTHICGDGMSDRDYPYSVMLVLESAGQREFLAGCCRLPLEAGSH